MSKRVYSKDKRRFRNYLDCSVQEEWLNFQNFGDWAIQQPGFNEDRWHLDKDIIRPGNRQYSSETCAFVPPEINALFTGSRGNRLLPRGVHVVRSKYVAQYHDGTGNNIKLGVYSTPEEAFEAYVKFKKKVIETALKKYDGKLSKQVVTSLKEWNYEL